MTEKSRAGNHSVEHTSAAVENIHIYREFARFYFATRNNLTYANMIACGAIIGLYAHSLIDGTKPFEEVLKQQLPLFSLGGFAVVAVAGWATAICSCLSNSIQAYMQMSLDLEEKHLHADYAPHRMRWGVEYEFLSHPQDVGGKVFQGIAWNGLNATFAVGALFLLSLMYLDVGLHWAAWATGVACALVLSVIAYLMFRKDDELPRWRKGADNRVIRW